MKFYIRYMLVFFVLVGETTEKTIWRNNIPSFFMRKFRSWAKNDTCEFEKLKSVEANISLTRMDKEFFHNIRTKVDAEGLPLKKIELRIESNGFTKRRAKALANRKFIANVQPFGNPQYQLNMTFSPVPVKEKRLELTFDISSIYNTSLDCFDELNFTVKIMNKNGKSVRSLIGNNVKAFAILYKSVESCSFMDFFNHDDILQTSSEVLRRLEMPQPILKSFSAFTNSELCRVQRFEVNFMELGLHWIIHPEEKNIGICSGFCQARSVVTGYRLLQNAMYRMSGKGQPSTCRPTEFGGMPIIYIDPLDGMPVIAQFNDMVVTQCDCF